MAITRLRVSNFRCINTLDFEVPRFSVMIGPNGVGKSTVLGCFRAFNHVAAQSLAPTFSEYGGFAQAVRWQSPSLHVEFGTTISDDSGLYDYSLSIEPEGRGYFISSEQVRYDLSPRNQRLSLPQTNSPRVIPEGYDFNNPVAGRMVAGFVLASSGLERIYPNNEGQVRRVTVPRKAEPILATLGGENSECAMIVDVFRKISTWDAHNLQLAEIRRPQPLQPAAVPTPNGDNLLSVLYGLKSERREAYDELIDTLRVFLPELKGIELPLVGKGYASLSWFQEGFTRPLDPQQLSDGTLRLLWLATVLHTVPDDGLVLIDEPELSMHPQWLQFLVGLMRHMSPRTQLLVATQSAELVRWLEPEELVIADLESGSSTLKRGDRMNLDDWLKDYSLDQLWHMGELGARR